MTKQEKACHSAYGRMLAVSLHIKLRFYKTCVLTDKRSHISLLEKSETVRMKFAHTVGNCSKKIICSKLSNRFFDTFPDKGIPYRFFVVLFIAYDSKMI